MRRLGSTLIGLTALTLIVAACQSDLYTIRGEARPFADGTLLCLTPDLNADTADCDTVRVIDGRFTYTTTATDTRLCRLYAPSCPDASVLLFTEPGNIYVELSPQAGHSRVSGTKTNNQWQSLCDTVARYDRLLRSLASTHRDSLSPRATATQMERHYATLTQRIREAAERNKDNALGRFIIERFTP